MTVLFFLWIMKILIDYAIWIVEIQLKGYIYLSEFSKAIFANQPIIRRVCANSPVRSDAAKSAVRPCCVTINFWQKGNNQFQHESQRNSRRDFILELKNWYVRARSKSLYERKSNSVNCYRFIGKYFILYKKPSIQRKSMYIINVWESFD